MRALDGELMLTAWEHCRERTDPERALALLELAAPEQPTDALASLPLGERDALLLQVHALTFGPRMEGFAVCPICGAQLEFAVNARELAQGLRAQPPERWREQDGEFEMRPANTQDLLACQEAQDSDEARAILVARTLGLEQAGLASVPPAWIERFDALNASAEIRVQLHCVACGGRPVLDLDVARFLGREIGTSARKLLADIHTLASAYGWSEQSIAAMSGARRAAYMEMLGT